MKPSKPREYWIEFSGSPALDKERTVRFVSGEEPRWLAPEDEAIHVIETTALKERDEVIEELMSALEKARKQERFQILEEAGSLNGVGSVQVETQYDSILQKARDKMKGWGVTC